jgi:hypothetical protein
VNAVSLYHNLTERGVILEAQGEHLKVDAPVGVVSEEEKRTLLRFKPDLLGFLIEGESAKSRRVLCIHRLSVERYGVCSGYARWRISGGSPRISSARLSPVAARRAFWRENGGATEWASERAAEALHYLERHYPECLDALRVLDAHEEAANEAARAGDREAYLEALRGYMRAGRDAALRIRKERGD